MPLHEYLALTLRQAMKSRRITQAQLVDSTGLAPRTVNLLLSGTRDFKVSSLEAVAAQVGLAVVLQRAEGLAGAQVSQENQDMGSALAALDTFPLGARALEAVLRKRGMTLSVPLAQSQWAAVQVHLLANGQQEVVTRLTTPGQDFGCEQVAEADEACVMDAWSLALTGQVWPSHANASTNETTAVFYRTLKLLGALDVA